MAELHCWDCSNIESSLFYLLCHATRAKRERCPHLLKFNNETLIESWSPFSVAKDSDLGYVSLQDSHDRTKKQSNLWRNEWEFIWRKLGRKKQHFSQRKGREVGTGWGYSEWDLGTDLVTFPKMERAHVWEILGRHKKGPLVPISHLGGDSHTSQLPLRKPFYRIIINRVTNIKVKIKMH